MTKKDNYPNLLKKKNHAQIITLKKKKGKQVYHAQESKIKKESKKINK